MAQTLVEDQAYSLQTSEDDHRSRQVYFVKLTDSCLKALEEHIQYQNATKSKPSVKFNGFNGVFSIPSKPGSASKDVSKKFQFSISSMKSNNTQGILECIKHPKKRVPELVSYGELESRILIAATDDVYENTRNRMAQVDQERKDVRTKEIELANMRKKKKKPKTMMTDISSYNKIPAPKKKVINPSITSKPILSSTSSNRHASPVSSLSSRSSPATVGKSFTCRERVMHILAIRPHKKPELISRLQREAMSQKDRNNLAMVLQQIATMQDNQYKLQAHLYSEVQVDTWPFYIESERLHVKNNISTHKPAVKTTSPQVVSSTSKSPEDKATTKRKLVHDSTESTKRYKASLSTSMRHDEPSSTTAPTKKDITNNKPHEKSKKENKDPGHESPPMVASTSDSPEYLTKKEFHKTLTLKSSNYKPITTYEQRCQYKRDFQAEYPEYIELKKNLDAVRKKFMELDQSWRREEKGTDEYLRIQEEIIKTYTEQQEDEKYHEMKQRCEELHQKLGHIKKLVVEYDTNMQT